MKIIAASGGLKLAFAFKKAGAMPPQVIFVSRIAEYCPVTSGAFFPVESIAELHPASSCDGLSLADVRGVLCNHVERPLTGCADILSLACTRCCEIAYMGRQEKAEGNVKGQRFRGEPRSEDYDWSKRRQARPKIVASPARTNRNPAQIPQPVHTFCSCPQSSPIEKSFLSQSVPWSRSSVARTNGMRPRSVVPLLSHAR